MPSTYTSSHTGQEIDAAVTSVENNATSWSSKVGDVTVSGTSVVSSGTAALGAMAGKTTANLTSDVTGTLPLANGGIGATTKSGGRTNLGIDSGSTLPGVSGYSEGDIFLLYDNENGIAVQSNRSVTPSTEAQTIQPSDGYTVMSQVAVAAIPYVETSNTYGTTVEIG